MRVPTCWAALERAVRYECLRACGRRAASWPCKRSPRACCKRWRMKGGSRCHPCWKTRRSHPGPRPTINPCVRRNLVPARKDPHSRPPTPDLREQIHYVTLAACGSRCVPSNWTTRLDLAPEREGLSPLPVPASVDRRTGQPATRAEHRSPDWPGIASASSRRWPTSTGSSTPPRSTARALRRWRRASSSAVGKTWSWWAKAASAKSHLIQSIGQAACVLGYRVRYTTSAGLLEDLRASLADQTLPPKRLRYWASFDLVILDEFGFDRIERLEASLPGELAVQVDRRPQPAAAIRRRLVTNIDFEAWGVPGRPAAGDGVLGPDRGWSGIILKIQGKSYRAHRAQPTSSTTSGGSS